MKRTIISIIGILVLLTMFLATATPVAAARTITSVTVDGGSSTTVAPGASITVVMNVTTSGGNQDDDWRSTSWRIGNSGGFTCVDHSNHYNDGSYSETFTITAPMTDGTYNLYLRAYEGDGCPGGGPGSNHNDTTLSNAVIVSSGPPTGITVTINQGSTQSDPTSATPINFDVVFGESVSDFTTGDVSLSGTANPTTAVVSGSGTTYNVAVSGMTNSGTVIAEIPAGVAHGVTGLPNYASTSDDNVVTYNYVVPNPSLSDTCGLDIVLVLDMSSSIQMAGAVGTVKNAALDFVDAFLDETPSLMAVVGFNTTAWTAQGLTDNQTSLNSAINGLSADGWTNWEDALEEATSILTGPDDRPDGQHADLIVIFTDGNPTAYGDGTIDMSGTIPLAHAVTAADAAKTLGIRIVAVGVAGATSGNLVAISGPVVSPPAAIDENTDVILSNFGDLADALADIASALCGGTITIHKVIDQDGNLGTTADQISDGTFVEDWQYDLYVTDGSATPTSGLTDDTGTTVAFDISIADGSAFVDITETVKNGYDLIGVTCTGATDNGTFNDSTDSIEDIEIGPLDIVSVTFYNQSPSSCRLNVTTNPKTNATLYIYNTSVGNGSYDPSDPGWISNGDYIESYNDFIPCGNCYEVWVTRPGWSYLVKNLTGQASGWSGLNTPTATGCTVDGQYNVHFEGDLCDPPVADFEASPLSGCAPLEVTFTDLSTGDPTSWSWDFNNDGTPDSTSSTPAPYTYNTSGTYTVSLTVTNDCGSDTETKTAYIIVDETPVATAPPVTLCEGYDQDDLEQAVADASGGCSVGTPTITDNHPASSTYTVDCANGQCTDSATGDITVVSNPDCGITAPSEVCEGETVDASVTAVGGATYTWTITGDYSGLTGDGTNAISFTADSAGTINIKVEVENDAGCTCSSDTGVDVTVNAPPIVTVNDVTVCDDQLPATLEADVSGCDIYLYQWYEGTSASTGTEIPGANSSTYSTSTAGDYTCEVTCELTGCTNEDDGMLTINPCPVADFSASPTSGCCELTVDFTNLSTDADSYTWDFGDSSGTSSATNPSHTYTTPGTYTVILTAHNNDCGDDSETKEQYVEVIDCSCPDCYESESQTIVSDDSDTTTYVTQTNTGTPTPFVAVLAWEPNSGTDPSYWDNNVDYDFSGSGADWIWESERVVHPIDGDVVVFQNTVNIPLDAVNITGTIHITCDNGYEVWLDGTTLVGSAQVHDGIVDWQASDLTEAYVNTSGWQTVEHFAISGLHTGDNVFTFECANEQMDTGTIDSNPGGLIFEIVINYCMPLCTECEMCENNECVPDPDKLPTASFTANPTEGCAPLTVDFTDTSTANYGSITGWSWDFDDGGTSTDQNPTHTFNDPGTYTVSLTVTNTCGQSDPYTADITVYDNPTASIDPDPAETCEGTALQLNGNPSGGSGTYTTHAWTGDTTYLSPTDAVNPTLSSSAPAGTYNLTYTVTDSNGCTGTDSITVTVHPNPDCSFTFDTDSADGGVCEGSTGHYVCITDDPDITNVAWSVSGDFDVNTIYASGNCLYFDADDYNSGSIAIQVDITNIYGCTCTNSVNITVYPNPDCTITLDTDSQDGVCSGSTGHSATAANIAGASYTWTVTGDATNVVDNGYYITFDAADYNTGNINVQVEITTAEGCYCTDNVDISVYDSPDCTITLDTDSADGGVCENTTGHSATAANIAGASYTWTVTGDATNVVDNGYYITFDAADVTTTGNINVQVEITTAEGCYCTDNVDISVYPNPDCTITLDTDSQDGVCGGSTGHSASVPSGYALLYTWTVTGDYTNLSGTSSNQITFDAADVTTTGNIHIEVTVENDQTKCSCSNSIDIPVYPSPDCTIDLSTDSACEYSTGLTASVTPITDATYAWTLTGDYSNLSGADTDNITFDVGAAGTVNVQVEITTVEGCYCTSNEDVTVNPSPVAEAGPDQTIALGGSVQIGGSPTASGGASPYSYSWTPDDGSLDDTTAANPFASPTSTTLYEVTVTDENGCTDTDYMIVTVMTTPPGGGAPGPDKCYLIVDMLGERTLVEIGCCTNTTVEECEAYDETLVHLLELEDETLVQCGDCEGCNCYPKIIVMSLSDETIEPPEGMTMVGPLYDFTGYKDIRQELACSLATYFDPTATILLNYDPELLADGASEPVIGFFSHADNQWVLLPPDTGRVAEIGTASGVTGYFASPFAVLASAPPEEIVEPEPTTPTPANFVASGLSITPAEVKTGEAVTISLNVANDGEESGTYTVELQINGSTVDSKVVTLGGGEDQAVSFAVSASEAGTYDADVAGLSGSFTVVKSSIWWIYLIIAAVVIILGLMALRFRRGKAKS